ncbi:ribonuclease III [Sphingomonas sp.]|uniref:ribonuclease III n=1 Tax=Sphingomonas sp. TaxID=28214 RepID=UPI00286C64D9|nr:ribonuclease III [Sphingomonas sp.]
MKLAKFVAEILGHDPKDLALFERARTHPSFGRDNYQRLEFLGDRVLGLVMAEWLSELFPLEQEGTLSHRFTTLVSRATCAEVARAVGVIDHIRLGKQARDDGAINSDNVTGDVVEALIAALYLDGGVDAARRFIRSAWAPFIDAGSAAPRHPKSLLHEWAEGHGRKPPTYAVIDRSGPPHAPRFTVRASVNGLGEAKGEGLSKQEAETAAAEALLEQVK